MTTDTKAIYHQLSQNPEFLTEVSEVMADALCQLLIDIEPIDVSAPDFHSRQNVLIQLATTRMELRNFVRQ